MKNLLKKIGSGLVAAAMIGGLVASSVAIQAFAATHTLQFVETPPVSLYSSESYNATSLVVTPVPEDLDGNVLTMSSFGSSPTLTVDPGITGAEEIESFTGITNNGNNTATLSGLTRDLNSQYPYGAGSTGISHGAGATVVFSNNPQLYNRLASWENDGSVTGVWSFSTQPVYPSSQSFTNPLALIDKAYADALSIVGAPTSTEISLGVSVITPASVVGQGTASTTPGAPYVLENKFATTTPGTLCTNGTLPCIPVGNSSGHIAQAFLDLTQQFNFTQAYITSASSTNATTTNETVTGNLIANNASFSGTVTGLSGLSATNFEDVSTTTIQAGEALYSGFGASDGGLVVTNFGTGSGSSNSISTGGNNRVLVVVVNDPTNGDSASAVSYGGTSMTEIDSDSGDIQCNGTNAGDCSDWILVNPATGSNTLSITVNAGTAYFYYSALANALQSGQPAAHSKPNCNSGTVKTQQSTTNGSIIVTGQTSTSTLQYTTAGWENNAANSTNIAGGDSGLIYPANTSVSVTPNNSTNGICFFLSIAPYSTVYQGVLQTSTAASSVTTRSQFINSYSTFLGFALGTAAFGSPITVQTSGIYATSSLAAVPSFYYLNDIFGFYSTTPGTNTRKIGIEASSTALVITNIW